MVKRIIGNSLLCIQFNQVLSVHLFFFISQREVVRQYKISTVF